MAHLNLPLAPYKGIKRECIVTLHVPLILKMQDIILFLRANYFMGHFKEYFERDKIFLTPK
jgi:hypothetical protein